MTNTPSHRTASEYDTESAEDIQQPSIVDRSIKLLMKSAPRAAFLLAGAPNPPDVAIRTEDVTVNIPEYRADQVFVVEAPEGPWGIQFEYQLAPKPKNLAGWQHKNASLNVQLGFDILLVILYLERGSYRTFPSSYTLQREEIRNPDEYQVVFVWKLLERIRKGDLQEFAPMLVLCLDHPTEEILEEEKAIILGLEVTDERRQELLALAIMLGRRQFSEAVLQRMFQEELPMLKQLSFVEEWIADGVREGFTEGRAEGRTEEARQNLLKVLHHCFGVVPTELESRVRTADAAWCENVIDLAFSAKSPVELMQQVTPSIQ